MGGWGISKDAAPKEKLKSEMADFINGLNSIGALDFANCVELHDLSMGLLDKMYDLAKSE